MPPALLERPRGLVEVPGLSPHGSRQAGSEALSFLIFLGEHAKRRWRQIGFTSRAEAVYRIDSLTDDNNNYHPRDLPQSGR